MNTRNIGCARKPRAHGRVLPTIAALIVLLAGTLATLAPEPTMASSELRADGLLVKFSPGTSIDQRRAAHEQAGGVVKSSIQGIDVEVVSVPSARADAAIAAYQRNPLVRYAEVDAVATVAATVNDPYFQNGAQWNMTKVQASQAWDVTSGSAAIKVAVVDTGVDSSGPELSGKVVVNVNFSNSATAGDLYGHGTHVAGIAAAATNNGIGVAGLGYNSAIMNVKVLDDTGSGSYSAVASGITWAADNGAKVINMSLGGGSQSQALEDAVNYAWNRGAVVVAAAGNSGTTSPFYPAYYANVIAVAATDSQDSLASWSNRGGWVDVAAPGVNIYSTVPTATCALCDPSGYRYLNGTSMAAPHVAGLAALVFTRASDANINGLLNDDVRTCIQGTADPISASGAGTGRINAYGAVLCSNVGGAVTGIVRDAFLATPVAGAVVSDGVRSAATDASGAYSLGRIPAGTYAITVSDACHLQSQQVVAVSAGQVSAANFTLTSKGTITGTVRDSYSGSAIAGASVVTGARSALTDAAGMYAISDIPVVTNLDAAQVTASATGYSGLSQIVYLGPCATQTLSFALLTGSGPTTGTITGMVTDASTTKAIAGATITDGTRTATTDNTGKYVLGNVPAGSHNVSASAIGYTTRGQAVSVTAGSTSTADFALTAPTAPSTAIWVQTIAFRSSGRSLMIDVTVAGETGPMPGAAVQMQLLRNGSMSSFSGVTNSNGVVTFVLRKAPAGTYTATVTSLAYSGYQWDTSSGVTSATYVRS